MYENLRKILERPAVYTKTNVAFWDDDYISQQMLKAHLDPFFDGASRELSFIEKSVAWIKHIVPPDEYPSLLDVGCGPGVYAERFYDAGYKVAGVDFSRRSIEYAKSSALKKGLHIDYCNQDYLSLKVDPIYDFATMIYCDYGALSKIDRQIIMRNIYQSLKCGGKFLLDVFSISKYESFEEKQTWEICDNGGFWRNDEYLELNRSCKYPNNITLEQIAIISRTQDVCYYLWNTCFSKESLIKEAVEAGFKVCEIFDDVAGGYRNDGHTIAILLEK